MKHTKKLSAIILSAIMFATGCADNTAPGGSTEIKDSDPTVTESTETDGSADSGNGTAAESKSVKDVIGDIHVKTKLKVLFYGNEKLENDYKKYFDVPDEVPDSLSYMKYYTDDPFAYVKTDYHNSYTAVYALINSDNSPDIVYFNKDEYVDGVMENLFSPVDDIIDFDLKEFQPYRQIQQQNTVINGKTYAPVYSLETASLLWYRKSIIEDNKFEDPWELYEKNEWTWSKFLEMCENYSDSANSKFGVDGYGVPDSLLATTGEGYVSFKDSRYVTNFRDEKLINAMDFLLQFHPSKKKLYYYNEEENYQSPDRYAWEQGNTLFWSDYSDYILQRLNYYKERKNFDDDEVRFVPFPRPDDEQHKYQTAGINSFMLVKGSKNIEGYKALIYSCALAENDEENKKENREQIKQQYGCSDEFLDRMDKVKGDLLTGAVTDYSYTLDPTRFELFCGISYIHEVKNWSYYNGKDYKDLLKSDPDDMIRSIEGDADTLNSKIEKWGQSGNINVSSENR